MLGLRNGLGIEPRIWVCPEDNDQTFPPGSTYDFEVPCEPNTWLYAVNASIQDLAPLGPNNNMFVVQVTDSATGARLFSQPALGQDITGTPVNFAINKRRFSGSGNGYRGPLFPLETPHLFLPPSYPVVRIMSLADNITMRIRVNLFCNVETVT